MNDAELVEKAVEAAQELPAEPKGRAVPIGPVPTSWNISKTRGSNGDVIVVEVLTPQGTSIYFLDIETGKKLGAALTQISHLADTGLIIPQ